MNERDRHREERLDRLFELARSVPQPGLTPEPGLPARVRALVEAGAASRPRLLRLPRWAWVPVTTAALALSVMAGGYIGYHAWLTSASSQTAAAGTGDAEMLMAAWSQSGFVENLDAMETDEVQE